MSDNINVIGNVKLHKFVFDYVDSTGANRQFSQESREKDNEGLNTVRLPFNFNALKADDVVVTLDTGTGAPEEIRDLDFFKYLVQKNAESKEEEIKFDSQKRQSLVLKDLGDGYFRQSNDENKDFPQMVYSDVTEKDMFGYPELSATDLLSNDGNGGIWGMHGLRKLELIVGGLPDMPTVEDADFLERANLYWYQRDGEEIPRIYETDIRWCKNGDAEERKYIAYINTNILGESAAEAESNAPEFSGRFELIHEYFDDIITYTFPIKVCVHDTTLDKKNNNHLLMKNIVSIDFGTSSTCAAIKGTGLPHLFTLSGQAKRTETGDNPYENPTNLMIYKWDEVYKQWQMENDNCPFFLTRSENHPKEEADYDSGYPVDDEYKSVGDEDGRRKMAAILTQLKLIPYFESYGKEIKFTPYWGRNRAAIRITDSLDPSDNNDQKFNPIAFYGYLLSRAINNPQNNQFYQNYHITYPVKFDKSVREKIRASLEYGIKRALPKPLRDATRGNGESLVRVKMEYAEPVACVGAIVGRQLIMSEDDKDPKLFAIYDLGGGTLDFAFGMFRPSITEEEKEEADQVIEILGIGGDDKVGGEKLIHKLAYKIYRDNRETMEENEIKFVLPIGELHPKGFEELLSKRGDEISDTNVNLLKEKLARHLFKSESEIDGNLTGLSLPNDGQNKVIDGTHFEINLRSKDGADVPVNLEVKGIDEFLGGAIRSTIDAFKEEMQHNFQNSTEWLKNAGIQNFKEEDVYIFLGGNASKQHYVEEIMKDIFAENEKKGHIQRVRDINEDAEKGDQYRLTEKTAVAFGQLKLGQYLIKQDAISKEDDMPPFLFNVGYRDTGTDSYVPVLRKNDISRKWQKANRIDNETLMTSLCYTTDPQCAEDTLKQLVEDVSDYVEGKKRMLYIRIYEEDSIEYRVGGVNDVFDDDEEPNEDMVLKLSVLDN